MTFDSLVKFYDYLSSVNPTKSDSCTGPLFECVKIIIEKVSKPCLIELRPKVPVNNISVRDIRTPPREREIERKEWID